ncbi:MAG TPA: hypothetical protein VMJ75_04965 [Candidatus Acidoferrales bacterium]|nr:hypothetical protein [Candidatus Acidoferrales bacterium]
MSQISSRKFSARGPDTNEAWCGEETICLYGWDSRSQTWHGPNALGPGAGPDRRLLQSLRAAPGNSWYGAVSCGSAGERATRFFVLVHDLSDCAVASIYCDESKAGPAEIVAVVPASRRARLREEFAFEFLAFARFLGALGAGDEVQVHDAIAAACTEHRDARAVVFSMSSGIWPRDLDPVLSCCVEKIAITLCEWLKGPGLS